MAYPSLGTFSYKASETTVIKIDSTVMDEVQKIDFSTKADYEKKKFKRVGSAAITSARGAVSYGATAALTLYEGATQADFLTAISQASPASLDATDTVTISVEVYDSESSGNLLYTWSLSGAYPMESSGSVDSGADANMNVINYESDNKWVLTVA